MKSASSIWQNAGIAIIIQYNHHSYKYQRVEHDIVHVYLTDSYCDQVSRSVAEVQTDFEISDRTYGSPTMSPKRLLELVRAREAHTNNNPQKRRQTRKIEKEKGEGNDSR